MQHDAVMAEVVELQLLDRRNDFFAVVSLVENAQRQDKHRICRIDADQGMVATFVNVDHIVAKTTFTPGRTGWFERNGLYRLEEAVLCAGHVQSNL